jgi:hypothetical protein
MAFLEPHHLVLCSMSRDVRTQTEGEGESLDPAQSSVGRGHQSWDKCTDDCESERNSQDTLPWTSGSKWEPAPVAYSSIHPAETHQTRTGHRLSDWTGEQNKHSCYGACLLREVDRHGMVMEHTGSSMCQGHGEAFLEVRFEGCRSEESGGWT